MTIQAITFDFWSTLYRYTRSPHFIRLHHIQTALVAIGRQDITQEAIVLAMQQAWDAWDHVWRTEQHTPGAEEWLTSVLDSVGAILPTQLFAETTRALENAILSDTTVPIEGVPQTLAQLSQYYRLGIISDTGLAPGCVLRRLLQRDGLFSYFTHFTFSDEFGRSKPHPAVFRAALEGLDAQPQQAIHIGDLRHTDVFGAKGVGMKTVRFAGVRDDHDDAYPEADFVARTYDELLHYFYPPEENEL
ncbi:MAG: HAD family hydrolase [Chloroflexi bacterium]|nr:HAD family hydrolase [Chloroflexota bacterium]